MRLQGRVAVEIRVLHLSAKDLTVAPGSVEGNMLHSSTLSARGGGDPAPDLAGTIVACVRRLLVNAGAVVCRTKFGGVWVGGG